MRQRTSTPIPLFPGVFAPVLSLDALIAGRDADGGPSFDIRCDAPSIEEQFEQREAVAAVGDFVESLPQREKDIVRRLFWQDETQTDIANSLGVSKMAISKAIARITKRARVALADHQHLAFSH
jgi:RNA polymerase sigma factor (sigma-70 family)